MPSGFLSLYDGVTRVDIDDDPAWWVEIKKALSVAESEDAEKALFDFKIGEDPAKPGTSKTETTVDPNAKLFEQVLASVVDWSLTDRDGTKLALDFDRELEKTAHKANRPNWMSPRRQSLLKLPQQVYDQLSKAVGLANGPRTRAEEARFPDGGERPVAIGQNGSSDVGQVPERAALSFSPGGPGGPAPTA